MEFNRQQLVYIKQGIHSIMLQYVDDRNDHDCRRAMHKNISNYLNELRSRHAIESFTVQCDGENNPPDEINRGYKTALIRVWSMGCDERHNTISLSVLASHDHSFGESFDRAMDGV